MYSVHRVYEAVYMPDVHLYCCKVDVDGVERSEQTPVAVGLSCNSNPCLAFLTSSFCVMALNHETRSRFETASPKITTFWRFYTPRLQDYALFYMCSWNLRRLGVTWCACRIMRAISSGRRLKMNEPAPRALRGRRVKEGIKVEVERRFQHNVRLVDINNRLYTIE